MDSKILKQMSYDLRLFRQPIVNEQDENLNYDDGLNVNYYRIPLFYQSDLFSGTTIEEGKDYVRVVEYENGLMQGKNVLYQHNIMVSEVFYNNAYEIKGKTWYEDGKLESIWDKFSAKSWDIGGNLKYEKTTDLATEDVEERFYFEDGKLKFRKFTNLHISKQDYFAADGEWLLTHKFLFDYSPMRDEAVYNDEALFKWYFEILDNEMNDSQDENHSITKGRVDLIWIWIWEVWAKDKIKFIEILAALLLHPQVEVIKHTIFMVAFHRYKNAIQDYYLTHNQSFTNNNLTAVFIKIAEEEARLDKQNYERKIRTL